MYIFLSVRFPSVSMCERHAQFLIMNGHTHTLIHKLLLALKGQLTGSQNCRDYKHGCLLISLSPKDKDNYFLPEAILTASTAHDKPFSPYATNSIFSFDIVRCRCSHFDITSPKSVLWWM